MAQVDGWTAWGLFMDLRIHGLHRWGNGYRSVSSLAICSIYSWLGTIDLY